LIEAFDQVLKTARIKMSHEVVLDRLSLSESITSIAERLQNGEKMRFADLLLTRDANGTPLPIERHRVVVTFLALLEMAKLKLLRILQEETTGELVVALRGESAIPQGGGSTLDDYRN
jgi:segregation and condensation protein A